MDPRPAACTTPIPPGRSRDPSGPKPELILDKIIICKKWLILVFLLSSPFPAGCGPVAGNYPDLQTGSPEGAVHHAGAGVVAVAGPRLELDRIRADLGLLRAQGFSARDPQILRSVARREKVPVSLIGDRTGAEFYRIRFRVAAGSRVVLRPGTVALVLDTGRGTRKVSAEQFLIEDRSLEAGCRSAGDAGLVLDCSTPQATVLVRAGLRGEIVGITVEPHLVRQEEPR